jgi:hypothetical protein
VRRLLELPIQYNLRVGSCNNTRATMVSKSKGKQVQMAGYYDPDAVRRLKALSEATRVPQSAYLREALDDLLKKYAGTLRKVR